jgi:hypothetical protein
VLVYSSPNKQDKYSQNGGWFLIMGWKKYGNGHGLFGSNIEFSSNDLGE